MASRLRASARLNIGPRRDKTTLQSNAPLVLAPVFINEPRDLLGSRAAAISRKPKAMFVLKLIYSVVAQAVLFGVLLFVPAQTLAWPRAWVFIAGTAAATAATMLYLRGNEDLINERLKGPLQKGQPLMDKIVLNLFLATFCGVIIFVPLDVFRFHITRRPGPIVSLLGLALVAGGWWLIALALHENAFATGVVRYQEERHQRVIDSGVYSKVRHPMYAGGVPFIVGSCLWLGSYAAAVLAVVPIAMIALRIQIEERFLRQALKGYQAYTERTPYRLIPYLW
jgi:protein-S-isoprenylcysteine O-methyltransferase Ste14